MILFVTIGRRCSSFSASLGLNERKYWKKPMNRRICFMASGGFRVAKKSVTFVLLGDIPSLALVILKNVISFRPNSHLLGVSLRPVFCTHSKMASKLTKSSSKVFAAVPRSSSTGRQLYKCLGIFA